MNIALNLLPWDLRSDANWYDRAVRAVAEAISAVGADASFLQQQTASARAAESITKEFEHAGRREQIVSWVILAGATSEDTDDARDAVRKALAGVPVGASDRQLQAARDAALAPFRAKIKSREDAEMRKGLLRSWGMYGCRPACQRKIKNVWYRTSELRFRIFPEGTSRSDLQATRDQLIEQANRKIEQPKAKGRLVEDGLREIGPCLKKLQAEGWEFEGSLSSVESEYLRPQTKKARMPTRNYWQFRLNPLWPRVSADEL
jgi:hypothetical protein